MHSNAECVTMAERETVNINVMIAERLYPLRVDKADEEKLRNAVKLVNGKIAEYQASYAGKDKQDYMAMCLLNYAVEGLRKDDARQQTDRIADDKISRIDEILSGVAE